jgi:hypothetical protein
MLCLLKRENEERIEMTNNAALACRLHDKQEDDVRMNDTDHC